MRKTIKLITALVVIGTAFTSCTQEETPTPQTSIQDFEGTYKYVRSASRTFRIEVNTETNFEGVEVVEILMLSKEYPARWPERIFNIQRVDANSFSGTYTVGNQPADLGDALIFIDPTGVRKLSIEHINGKLYYAQEED